MSKEKYLITGATGATGKTAAHELLEKGLSVRAFVRQIDERSDKLNAAGAEIIVGDLLDFHSINAAMKGITGVYFMYPIEDPGILESTAYFIQAAREEGVKNIVNMSQISARRDSKSHAAQNHWIAERLLDMSGIAVTHIRPTFFAQWLLYGSASIKAQDKIVLPFGDGRFAPIAAEDQGRVIAELLLQPEKYAGEIYPLFGPVEYNQYEVAEILTKELRRTITYDPISIGAFQKIAAENKYTPHFIQHISAVAQDCRDGLFAGTGTAVKDISGRDPMGVKEFIHKHLHAFEK
jgi:NAD(P)H dehydrogenase (quinone)